MQKREDGVCIIIVDRHRPEWRRVCTGVVCTLSPLAMVNAVTSESVIANSICAVRAIHIFMYISRINAE